MSRFDPLLAPMHGAERRIVGGVQLEVASAGSARVKRMIYPVGFRWSVDMKPIVDFERETAQRLGMARGHRHDSAPPAKSVN